MKRRTYRRLAMLLVSAAFIAGWFIFRSLGNEPVPDNMAFASRSGTAIVITGAAARIAQESALLEQLYRSGRLKDVSFISGTSSGALNAVLLNAILTGRYSWNQLYELYKQVDNGKIYRRSERKFPVDTEPLKELITQVVNDTLGFDSLGSLPVPTSFSVTDIQAVKLKTRTYRLSNVLINPESDPTAKLIEVLMASTAIPVLFPPAKITSAPNLPKSSFIDGGLAEDHIPYLAVLQYEKYTDTGVDSMIIVSRNCDTGPRTSSEFSSMGIENSKFYQNMGYRLENYTREGFIKSMKELQKNYPDLASRTYVYIPDFEEYFPLLDFTNLALQYEVAAKWASAHQPVPLGEYLSAASEQ